MHSIYKQKYMELTKYIFWNNTGFILHVEFNKSNQADFSYSVFWYSGSFMLTVLGEQSYFGHSFTYHGALLQEQSPYLEVTYFIIWYANLQYELLLRQALAWLFCTLSRFIHVAAWINHSFLLITNCGDLNENDCQGPASTKISLVRLGVWELGIEVKRMKTHKN